MDGLTLGALVKSIGTDSLNRIIRDGIITATFLSDNLGTITNTSNGLVTYNYVAAWKSGTATGLKFTKKDWVADQYKFIIGNGYGAGRKAKKFLELISLRDHANAGILEAARSDILDNNYMTVAADLILRRTLPNIAFPEKWHFRVVQIDDDKYVIDTNLEFDKLNRLQNLGTSKSAISPAWVLTQILDVRADLTFATDYMAEFSTDEVNSKLIQMKVADLLRRRSSSDSSIAAFQKITLNNSLAIREAINSGEHSFDEFLKLLDKARKFKLWLSSANPDSNLIQDYLRAATEDTWAERLPTKGTHFLVSSIAGAALSPVASLGLNLADNLFFDRIVKGWRPHHFISGPLQRFVGNT